MEGCQLYNYKGIIMKKMMIVLLVSAVNGTLFCSEDAKELEAKKICTTSSREEQILTMLQEQADREFEKDQSPSTSTISTPELMRKIKPKSSPKIKIVQFLVDQKVLNLKARTLNFNK